ncbi:hypothetical protein ES703_06409 [subsurface metagenome]
MERRAGVEKIPRTGSYQSPGKGITGRISGGRENQSVNLMEHPIALVDAVSIDLPVSMASKGSASLNTGATTMVLA